MLLQKPQDVPYIGIFKTQAGEEFIGKVVGETPVEYQIKHPLCMIPTERGLQFAPFIMMADPEKAVTIPKPMITGIPSGKLEEQYEQAISPIQLIKKHN
jgi:hypothetical protein